MNTVDMTTNAFVFFLNQVARASMAVGLLGVYVDGFQMLYALDLKEHWSEAMAFKSSLDLNRD